MTWIRALLAALLLVQPVAAQTVAGDRVRLNAAPCTIDSVDGTPDKLRLVDCSTVTTGGSSNLTLNPAGDLVLQPAGVDVLPGSGYTVNLGALSNKYLALHAAELWVETLVAQNTMATLGGRVLVAPTNILTADILTGATSISVKYNNLANGDRVYLEANGAVEFMAIASSASGSGPYTYTVTRNLDGSGANAWSAGDAVLNTGTTGNGFIDLYSTAGVLSGSGPSIVGNVRTGTTYNAIAPRWAIGNLNGLYGYGATTYGAAFGDASATNVTVDATNGFRIRSGTTDKLSADTSGNLSLAGDLAIGGTGVFHTANASAYATGIGVWTAGTGGSVGPVSYLVVGGGGGGGGTGGAAGGGGGGRVATGSKSLALGAYTVTVGAGGSAGTPSTAGTSGGNSSALSVTATGGTAGAGLSDPFPQVGGTSGSGNAGGAGYNGANKSGGGGGGNGATGSAAVLGAGGAGGAGTASSITGSSVTYGGGGGGGSQVSGGAGGAGGGGAGGVGSGTAVAGTANTGGGGGGNGSAGNAGGGGSGIVVISYPTGTITATGGSISTCGSNTCHTFTSSGTFTVTGPDLAVWRVGDPAGQQIAWDGSALSVTGNAFIDGSALVTGSVTATQIAAATITGSKIAASTITASNLSVSSLSAITADLGTVTSGSINIASGVFSVASNGDTYISILDSGTVQTTNLSVFGIAGGSNQYVCVAPSGALYGSAGGC